MPQTIVNQKNARQPIASTRNPLTGPGEDAGQPEQAREERELRRREAALRETEQEHGERARAHAGRELLEADRGVHERAVDRAVRHKDVARRSTRSAGRRRPTAAWPSPIRRGDGAAEERARERRRESDGPERDAAVVRAVPHVDQERPQERAGQVVGELVEDDERQDLEARDGARGNRGTAARSRRAATCGATGRVLGLRRVAT